MAEFWAKAQRDRDCANDERWPGLPQRDAGLADQSGVRATTTLGARSRRPGEGQATPGQLAREALPPAAAAGRLQRLAHHAAVRMRLGRLRWEGRQRCCCPCWSELACLLLRHNSGAMQCQLGTDAPTCELVFLAPHHDLGNHAASIVRSSSAESRIAQAKHRAILPLMSLDSLSERPKSRRS